jgi:hypothetical protein
MTWNQQEFDAIVPPIGNANEGDDITPFEIPFQRYRELQIDTSRVALVAGFLQEGAFVVIYGEFGSAKTALAVHLAGCVGQGKEFFGRKTKQCGVIYFAFEAGASIIKRLLALNAPKDIPIYIVTMPLDITTLAAAGSIVNLIKKIETEDAVKIGLVIVDTLSRAVGGDFEESDNGDMNQLAAMCDGIRRDGDVAVILVHHEGKTTGRGTRGAVALPAAVDTMLHCFAAVNKIYRASDKHPEGGKQRDLEELTEFVWKLEQVKFDQLDDDGNEITSVIIEELTNGEAPKMNREPRSAKPSAGDLIVLRALKQAIAEHGKPVTPTDRAPKGAQCADNDLWRRYHEMLTTDQTKVARDKAFDRGAEKLQVVGMIGIWGDEAWVI